MTKPDLTLLKIPTTLADIYALVEHLTGRPVTEAEKRACERHRGPPIPNRADPNPLGAC